MFPGVLGDAQWMESHNSSSYGHVFGFAELNRGYFMVALLRTFGKKVHCDSLRHHTSGVLQVFLTIDLLKKHLLIPYGKYFGK